MVLRLTCLKIPLSMRIMFSWCCSKIQYGISIFRLYASLTTAIYSSSVHNQYDKTRNLASPWARHVENDPRLLLSAALTRLCGSRIAGAVGLAKKCVVLVLGDRRLVSPNRVRIISQDLSKATRGSGKLVHLTSVLYFFLAILIEYFVKHES